MTVFLHPLLIGSGQDRHPRKITLLLAGLLFVITFASYAFGIFETSGGVIWIPADAALVGVIAAAWVGYSRNGLVFAWLVAYTSLLGSLANHYFLGLSGRTFFEELTLFVQPDGLVFIAVEGLVIGTVAFVAGFLGSKVIDSIRTPTPDSR